MKPKKKKKMDLNQISGDGTSIKLYWILLGNPFMHPYCFLYHFLQQLLQTLSPTSTLQDQPCHLISAWKGFAQLSVCLPFTHSLESLVKSFLHKYSFPPFLFIPSLSQG